LKQEVCSQSKSPFCNVVRTFGPQKSFVDFWWPSRLSNLEVFKVFFRHTLTWQTSVQKFLFWKKFLVSIMH